MKRIREFLLQAFFPRKCPVCGEILIKNEQAKNNPFICKYCYVRLDFCDKEKKDDIIFANGGASLLVHDVSARKILYRLKYSRKLDNADFLGRESALRFAGFIIKNKPDVFIPVPLHKKRFKERGFNQAEIIARNMSDGLKELYGIDIALDNEYLIRKKETLPQKELDRDSRAENVRGKFAINEGRKNAAYKRAVLIEINRSIMIQRKERLKPLISRGFQNIRASIGEQKAS